jgi:hypothetical protein
VEKKDIMPRFFMAAGILKIVDFKNSVGWLEV